MDKEIIIDMKIENSEALQATVALTDKLNELKRIKKEVESELANDRGNKELKTQLAAVNAQIDATSGSLRGYRNELKNMASANNAQLKSLEQMRAQLNALTKQWDRMSAAERESTQGLELAGKINVLNGEVSELEQSTGRFQRNVGNYKSALEGAKAALQGLGTGAGGAIGAIQGLGAAMKALIANPLGAAIAAIVVVFNALRKAFKENDDSGTALAAALAAFKPIVDLVKNALSLLSEVIAKVVTLYAKLYTAVLDLIPAFKKQREAAQEAVVAADALEDKERELALSTAENEKIISENNAKVAERQKYSAAQRKKMLEENARLERENMEANRSVAKERLRIALLELQNKRKWSDADKDRITELKVAVINAEKDYSDALVSINKKTSKAIAEIDKEEEDARREREANAKVYAEKRKQQEQERLELNRKIEDTIISIMQESLDKELKIYDVKYQREVEDLKKQAKEKPHLAANINKLLIAKEKEYQIERANIITKYNNDAAENEKKAAEERAKAVAEAAAKVAKDNNLREQARQLAEENNLNEQLSLANSEQEKLKIVADYAAKRLELNRYMYENMQQMEDESDAEFALRKQQQLKQLHQFTSEYESATNSITEKSVEIKLAQLDTVYAFTGAAKTMGDALIDALAKSAQDEEKYQKWKLVMSIIEAQIQGALAIMAAITTATPGDPYSVAARIASAAAAAGAATIAATAELLALKGATPAAPKFATGGYVRGAGTGTSDSIDAKLSNGEFVVNARSTREHLAELVAINGGWGNTSGMLPRFATGGYVDVKTRQAAIDRASNIELREFLANMPAPVVSVKEITNTQKKVQVKENLARR